MEVAFQVKLKTNGAGEVSLDDEWFKNRIEDCTLICSCHTSMRFFLTILLDKVIHQQPQQLDLVGWFTLGPSTGPEQHMLPIHSRISELFIESPLLVLFHPENAFSEATAAGKLPLTLYEPVSVNASSEQSDKAMDIDGAAQAQNTKFRELVYSIETGEAEMISVDFVARGGGNATAVQGSADLAAGKAETPKADEGAGKKATRSKTKDKGKEKEKDVPIEESTILTAEDEECKHSSCRVRKCRHTDSSSAIHPHGQDERHPHAEPTYLIT